MSLPGEWINRVADAFAVRDANTAAQGGPVSVQPGRPDSMPERYPVGDQLYDDPRVLVVDPQGHALSNVLQRGRKLVLRGTWTLRQYRNPTECGAQFALHPGPDATYQWEVLD